MLLCISTVIRPKRLLETLFVMRLMQAGPKLSHLPRQAITNIYISLIGYLALPWKNIEEQQQDYTSLCNHVSSYATFSTKFILQFSLFILQLCEYVECQAQCFLELDSQASVSKISLVMPNILGVFSEVTEYFKDSCNTTKDMLAVAFRVNEYKKFSIKIYKKCTKKAPLEYLFLQFPLRLGLCKRNELEFLSG